MLFCLLGLFIAFREFLFLMSFCTVCRIHVGLRRRCAVCWRRRCPGWFYFTLYFSCTLCEHEYIWI